MMSHRDKNGVVDTDNNGPIEHSNAEMLGAQFLPGPSTQDDRDSLPSVNATPALTSAHSSTCDRRLSRAARSLLLRHLRSILGASDDGVNTDTASVWQLLEHALAPSAYTDKQCPLIPTKDVLKHHEEHSRVLLPPPKKAHSRLGLSIRSAIYKQAKRTWQSTAWYQCGFCGKMFSSQFYLDQHLDHHHAHQISPSHGDDATITTTGNNDHSDSFICPATSWCHALPSCSQQALELEPYYGPGSGGISPHDRYDVHRALWKEAHPDLYDNACDEAQMRVLKHRCQQMMRDCFSTPGNTANDDEIHFAQRDIHRLLEQSLCETISCPDRLHQLFFAATVKSNEATSMMMKHVHDWQDDWEEYYEEHHGMGRMGIVLLVVLGIWYATHLWRTFHNRGSSKWLRHSKDQKGSRLLQKSSKTSSSSSLIFGIKTRKSVLRSGKAKIH